MKTLLILAYEHAPFNRPGSTIGAQRPYQFTKYLFRFGWRSIALCCDYKTRYTLEKRSDWKKQVREIVSVALTSQSGKDSIVIPLPSLKYAGYFDRLWHQAVVMDVARGTFSPRGGIFNQIVRPIATFFKLFSGDHSESWQQVSLYASELILSKIKTDMILAEHSPDASVFVASRLSKKSGIPWIIDFRDPMLRDLKKIARFFYKYFTIPRFSNVSGTINVNDYWVEQDRKLFKRKTCTILNGFDPVEFPETTSDTSGDSLRIGYFGSIQPGQNLRVFLHALKQLSGTEVFIQFVYRGNRFKEIVDFFQGYNFKNVSIDSSDSVPREESIRLMASCDVLLLLSLKIEGDIYLKKGVVPGKTFEYFALKKPILLSTGDDDQLDKLILQSGAGMIGRDSDAIQSLLRTAYKQKKAGEKIWDVSLNEGALRTFTREKQTGLLAEFMESLLK